MKVEVSDGEILDKLSILEIKLDNIEDETKLANIRKEHNIYKHKKKLLSGHIWEENLHKI